MSELSPCANTELTYRSDDEVVSRSLTWRFFYKDTGAPITERQETRYKANECMLATGGRGGMPVLQITKLLNKGD